jgi:hypothetical protein
MKRLASISNQIKNKTYSYTGKGAFEITVNNFKNEIIIWLENLVPLQQQIEYLYEKSNLKFQKRNYTRILTKILPKQYNEFVSINILIRDANAINEYYSEETDFYKLYNNLLKDNYLKYPGRYKKYVEFDIFQRFVITYQSDLFENAENNSEISTTEENEDNKEANLKTDTNWLNLLIGK